MQPTEKLQTEMWIPDSLAALTMQAAAKATFKGSHESAAMRIKRDELPRALETTSSHGANQVFADNISFVERTLQPT
jgi:hypothetical protein